MNAEINIKGNKISFFVSVHYAKPQIFLVLLNYLLNRPISKRLCFYKQNGTAIRQTNQGICESCRQ